MWTRDRQLLPMLRGSARSQAHEVEAWTTTLIQDTQQLLAQLLPLRENEAAFLEQLNDDGEIHPEQPTTDEELQQKIILNPGLQWKALNVRRHRQGNP